MLEENVPVWRLWERVCTQWRVGFGPVGLDYSAVFAVAGILGMAMTPELLGKLQVLEREILREASEKMAQD